MDLLKRKTTDNEVVEYNRYKECFRKFEKYRRKYMKKVQQAVALFLCAVMVLGFVPWMTVAAAETSSPASAATALEIKNAGFEETAADGVPGWMDTHGKLAPKGKFERSTAQAHSGSASMKITDAEDGASTLICSSGTIGIAVPAHFTFATAAGSNKPGAVFVTAVFFNFA